MKRDITLYLKDILKNMEKAEKFIEDMSYKEFIADEDILHFSTAPVTCHSN